MTTTTAAEHSNQPSPGTRSAYSICDLQARAYQQSADKGFHDDEPTEARAVLSLNCERIALMRSELSEALEELRAGHRPDETYYLNHAPVCMVSGWQVSGSGVDSRPDCTCTPKPEGVPSEMADVVIRVLDFCGANGIDLETIIIEKLDYNATRPHRHGGKEF